MLGAILIAVVTPAYRNGGTLPALVDELAVALEGRPWGLRIVDDASPDDTLPIALELAAVDPRLAVSALATNVGQNRALLHGLAEEPFADAWVCLDADLQDPPAAIPTLLDRLATGDVDAVFAGRRGRYEVTSRLLSGRAYRTILSRLTGLPGDAGAFVACNRVVRDALVRSRPPGVVAGIGACRVRSVSVPVERRSRAVGESSWTGAARVRHSARTLAWLAGQRLGDLTHR